MSTTIERGTIEILDTINWEDLTPPCRFWSDGRNAAEWIGRMKCCGGETFMCTAHKEFMVEQGLKGLIDCPCGSKGEMHVWERL